MRCGRKDHTPEIDRFVAAEVREPLEVLMVFDEKAIGFVELSIRPYGARLIAANRTVRSAMTAST
jgi:hypothetical protein